MPVKQKIFKLTTEVPSQRSVAGIIDMLAQARAKTINQEFGDDGRVKSVCFVLTIPTKGDCLYQLPSRTEPVYQLLKSQQTYRSRAKESDLRQQAERVAWRQVFAWVEAQLAMIQTGMVEAGEVFMPYQFDGRQTLFQAWSNHGLLAAPAANGERA